jgi:transposase InsO family protein
MRHARRLIEAWQREYNEGRPKKGLGGLTPVEHARRVAKRSIIVSASLQIGVLLNKG